MSGPVKPNVGRFHVIAGTTIFVVGLIALSPIISIGLAKLFSALLGLYVIQVTIDQHATLVLVILTAAGTAALVGGAWIVTTGYRRRRHTIEHSGELP
jgi:ABC-type uncharacterized transport system permease subunit